MAARKPYLERQGSPCRRAPALAGHQTAFRLIDQPRKPFASAPRRELWSGGQYG
jgi:hypothetical protein